MTLLEFITVVDDYHTIYITKFEHINKHNTEILLARVDTGTTVSVHPSISPGATQRELTAYPDMTKVHQYLRRKVKLVRTQRDGSLQVILE